MAGKLISELIDAGFLQTGDFIPIARGTSTFKLAGSNLIGKDSQGRFSLGPLISTGLGASTDDCNIELGGLRTNSGNAYIDLHSAAGTDYEARLARWTGINGGLSLINTGTGNFDLWQTGAGSINLGTSNTVRMTINSVGYIGIGQTSPESALHITGDQGVKSDIILEAIQTANTTDSTGPAFVFRHKGGQLYTKTNDIISQISSRGYSTVSGQVGYQLAGEISTIATGNFNSTSTRNADITFSTSNAGNFTEKLRIKSNGYIGIGTSVPASTLDIQPGWLKLGRNDTVSEGGQLDFCRAGDNASVWTIDQWGTGTSNPGSLRFFNTQTGAVRMFINPDGRVGIGNTAPEANLHVTGTGNLLKITGSTEEFHGMAIKTADASNTTGRVAYWDHQNESNSPVSSMHSYVHADGGSDLYFHNSPIGTRTQDRRIERMRFDKLGNLTLNVNHVGIGRSVDGNYRLAVSGRTYSGGYRADQGAPNAADSSTTGYTFGADGDTGMFSIGAGAGAGTLGFYTNGNQAMYIDGSNLVINRNLQITINGQLSVNKEFQILNTPNANQLRLVQGNYGVIQRNDGSSFYLLPTFSGAQLGDWSNLRPFAFSLSTGLVTIGNGLNVTGAVNATSFVGNGSNLTNLTLANIVGLQQELDNRFNNVQTGIGGTTSSLTTLLNNKIEKPASPQNGQLLFYNGSTWVASTLGLAGDIVSAGSITTYNNVVPANKGGAGSINGLLKANGQGTVSRALPSLDYATPLDVTTVRDTLQINKINKPSNPISGQVLTYDGSTATWVASAAQLPFPTVSEPALGLGIKGWGHYNASYYTKNQVYCFGHVWAVGYSLEYYNPPVPCRFEGNYLANNPSITITKMVDHATFIIVLLSDGTLWATGNLSRILNITPALRDDYSGMFMQLNRAFSFKSVADFSFASTNENIITIGILCTDGSAFAWGYNGFGQLGRGNTTTSTSPVAISVPGKTVAQISVAGWGGTHGNILLRMTDGTLYAAGYNAHGQLGVGDTTGKTTFTQCKVGPTVFLTGVTKICEIPKMQGGYTRFVITNGGLLWGTGLNDKYQLGTGNTTNSSYYRQMYDNFNNPLTNITKVVTAGWSTNTLVAALASNGTVYTWGESGQGATGQGAGTDVNKPVAVTSCLTRIPENGYTGEVLPPIKDIFGTDCSQTGALGLISHNKQLFIAGYQIFPPITQMRAGASSTTTYYKFELCSVTNVEEAVFYTNQLSNGGGDSVGTIVRDIGGQIWIWGYNSGLITPNDRLTYSPVRINY
jgi:hypothetical protein